MNDDEKEVVNEIPEQSDSETINTESAGETHDTESTDKKTGGSKMLFVGLAVLLVLIGGGYFLLTKNSSSRKAVVDDQSSLQQEMPTQDENTGLVESQASTLYTIDDVAAHSTETDCWMVIAGSVYDVSEYIRTHPGGKEILQGCGIDATNLFETRPMGSNTPHSEKARGFLDSYYIGDLIFQ